MSTTNSFQQRRTLYQTQDHSTGHSMSQAPPFLVTITKPMPCTPAIPANVPAQAREPLLTLWASLVALLRTSSAQDASRISECLLHLNHLRMVITGYGYRTPLLRPRKPFNLAGKKSVTFPPGELKSQLVEPVSLIPLIALRGDSDDEDHCVHRALSHIGMPVHNLPPVVDQAALESYAAECNVCIMVLSDSNCIVIGAKHADMIVLDCTSDLTHCKGAKFYSRTCALAGQASAKLGYRAYVHSSKEKIESYGFYASCCVSDLLTNAHVKIPPACQPLEVYDDRAFSTLTTGTGYGVIFSSQGRKLRLTHSRTGYDLLFELNEQLSHASDMTVVPSDPFIPMCDSAMREGLHVADSIRTMTRSSEVIETGGCFSQALTVAGLHGLLRYTSPIMTCAKLQQFSADTGLFLFLLSDLEWCTFGEPCQNVLLIRTSGRNHVISTQLTELSLEQTAAISLAPDYELFLAASQDSTQRQDEQDDEDYGAEPPGLMGCFEQGLIDGNVEYDMLDYDLPQVMTLEDLEYFAQQSGYLLVMCNGDYTFTIGLYSSDVIVLACNTAWTHVHAIANYNVDEASVRAIMQPAPEEITLALAMQSERVPRQRRKQTQEQLTAQADKISKESLKQIRNAVNDSRGHNKEADKIAHNTINAIERRLIALERNKTFTASNFSAANFRAASAMPSQLLAQVEGLEVPASNAHEALVLFQEVIQGDRLMPKRFGEDSLMMPVTCNLIKTLSGLVAGSRVVVVSPLLQAYKGALIFQIPPGSTVPVVVGYVAPDRDVEEFSTRAAVSFASLSISAPLVVGGTSVIVGQMTVESGLVSNSPLGAIEGKLATIATGHHAPQEIMGSKKHTVAAFTADMPDFDVLRFSATDRQNTSLVTVPNSASQQAVGQLVSTPARCVRFCSSLPVDSSSATAAGWLSTLNTSTAITTAGLVIWNFNTATDYLRHLWYGEFSFDFNVGFISPATDAILIVDVIVTYSDGSTVSFTSRGSAAGATSQTVAATFSTRGNSGFEAKTGLFISNIQIQLDTTVNCTFSSPNLSITFDEIPAGSEYLVHLITGAVSQAQLNIEMKVHVECFPDPTTISGKYVTPTDDLPYTTGHLPDLIRALKHSSTPLVYDPEDLAKASFWGKVKKGAKYAWNHGGKDVAKIGVRAGLGVLGAARSFGDGSKARSATGICFPAVLGEQVLEFGVFRTHGDAPGFVLEVTDVALSAGTGWEGESADLAFLLAALQAEGWAIAATERYPLCASGDIEDLRVYGPDEVAFTLYPIKDGEKKINSPTKRKFIVTVDGFLTTKGLETRFPTSLLFGSGVKCEVLYIPEEGQILPHWEVTLRR